MRVELNDRRPRALNVCAAVEIADQHVTGANRPAARKAVGYECDTELNTCCAAAADPGADASKVAASATPLRRMFDSCLVCIVVPFCVSFGTSAVNDARVA